MNQPNLMTSPSTCKKFLHSIHRFDIRPDAFFDFLMETSMLGEFEAAVHEYDRRPK